MFIIGNSNRSNYNKFCMSVCVCAKLNIKNIGIFNTDALRLMCTLSVSSECRKWKYICVQIHSTLIIIINKNKIKKHYHHHYYPQHVYMYAHIHREVNFDRQRVKFRSKFFIFFSLFLLFSSLFIIIMYKVLLIIIKWK